MDFRDIGRDVMDCIHLALASYRRFVNMVVHDWFEIFEWFEIIRKFQTNKI
jgi:hypothetical protein